MFTPANVSGIVEPEPGLTMLNTFEGTILSNNYLTSEPLPALLAVGQVARDVLGVSERTVYRMIEDGEISAVKVRGALRINRDALLAQFGLGEVANA